MRATLLASAVLATLAVVPAGAQVAPPVEPPLIAKVLPIAAGALVGTAASYFILPLVVPTMAATSAGVGATVASPMVGAMGAVVGGTVGWMVFGERH